MKILVLANKDIASNLALNYLLKACFQDHQFAVMLSASVGNAKQAKPQSLQDLVFFEQGLFNQILFPALLHNKRPNTSCQLSFDQFVTLGVEVTDVNALNNQFKNCIHDFAPDLIVSVRFGLILPADIIAIPKFGVINLHSGELPNYRGVMATFRAMMDGVTEYATTLHYIQDQGIDNGAIIKISHQPLDLKRSYYFNTLDLYQTGIEDVIQAIKHIDSHGYCRSYASSESGNYFTFPTNEELAEFFARGLRLYDYQDIIDVSQAFLAIK